MRRFACRSPRDVASFSMGMKTMVVDCLFNLCETVDENNTLAWHPAAVFELMGVAFSGSPSAALMLTTDKALTKQLLQANGIRTPRISYGERHRSL